MNIMKTNMLSIDSKIKKEETGIPAVQMPAVSKAQSNIGMKALMFQGMQNLMANPMLAKEAGVMKDEPKAEETDSAKSFVAPYSSNIAFQGKFANATKIAALAAMLTLGAASCTKENFSQSQTQIVDTEALAAAITNGVNALQQEISELRRQIADNEAANAERDRAMLEALNNAYSQLLIINASINRVGDSVDEQNAFLVEFRNMVYGEFKNGEYQRSSIVDAIMVLQQITESEARSAVDKILKALENKQISEQEAMRQIMDLLKENNSLLRSVLSEIKSAKASADAYAKSLLTVAQEIDKNGKASLTQQQTMIDQNNALIAQNNILITQGQELIEKADQLKMSVDELTVVAQLIGKSLEDVMKMSKSEIIAAIKANNAELKITNEKLDEINEKVGNNSITIEEAASEIIKILGDIGADVSEIKAMLAEHFAKYDVDMKELKSLAYATRKDLKKLGFAASSLAFDIRTIAIDLKDIRAKIKNGGTTIDYRQLEEMFKRINANQQMSANEIIARLDAFIAGQENIADKLDATNEKIDNNTISAEEAAKQIISILENIDANVEDIKAVVTEFVAKFDNMQASIDDLVKLAAKSYKQQKYQSVVMTQIRNGIGALYADAQAKNKALKEISDKLDKGGSLTAAEMEQIAKRLNGNIQASMGEISALIKAQLKKDDTQIAYLASISNKLDGLGSLSQDILNEIANMGDDLGNLASIDAKLDELITLFKSYMTSFDKYAKNAMDAHGQEIALLNNIKSEIKNVGDKTQTLINQGKKAEIQRTNIENYLKQLNATADKIEAKLGRIPTVEEFDIMLNKHDAANQKYYGDLIKAAGVDPAKFDDIKALLNAINKNLVDFQGESTGLLKDILARIKAMDTTAHDNNEKLNKIIDLLENFHFECNCQCDCDDNHNIHEGIIGVLD